jgi:hypothetical protein
MTIDTKRRRWCRGALGLAVALGLGCSGRATGSEDDGDGTAGDSASSAEGMSDGLDGTTHAEACEWEEPIALAMGIEAAPECTYLVSQEEVAPVTIRVVNEGDAVVWLTGPGSVDVHAAIEDAAGQHFWGYHCMMPCEATLLGECACLLNCPLAGTIALHPGGTFEIEWPGHVWQVEPQQASEECAGDCAGECNLRTSPAPGPMQVMLAKATALDCGDDCECEPDANGSCVAPGYPEDWEFVELVEHTVQWPLECPLIEIGVQ